ncbi:ubiquinone/menaquinone biosynthesis C-methyltransferase UbiE-like [Bolinopsis microptera]|uniref:ubiquinone/menaquinone biosynthesis C-methyltransferase UbiE-like n=1 Tax=Bolinopsis microptera TaxID=2820187 RepID=UPI003079D9B4
MLLSSSVVRSCRILATQLSSRILATQSSFHNPSEHNCVIRSLHTTPCNHDNETHFGYQTIPESEKESKVKEVFERVADTYDLMNDAMSLGVHRLWKDHFVTSAAPKPNYKCLDVAGGTGDIAFKLHNHMSNINRDCEKIVVCDINKEMLRVGQERAKESGAEDAYIWLEGNAELLELPDNTFDLYTIAYGIRNCTHIEKVLEEAYRVLKPGGRFMCLEFSEVNNPVLSQVYEKYSHDVIPVLGQVIAGDFESYQYLVESIRKFPNQETFAEMIAAAGFEIVEYENLTFGVTAIHSGYKL